MLPVLRAAFFTRQPLLTDPLERLPSSGSVLQAQEYFPLAFDLKSSAEESKHILVSTHPLCQVSQPAVNACDDFAVSTVSL